MKIINKIAFLIHNEMILDHFYPVFKYLDPNDYDLIFLNDVKEKKINKKFLINNNFKFLKTWSSYWKKNKYKISISNLYIDGSRLNKNYFYLFIKKLILKLDNIFSKKIFKDTSFRNFILNQEIYFPLKVGRINIRFLYGIWFDSFQIGKFNNLYDYILSHGPYDGKIFKDKFPHLKIFKMGYPKYEEKINKKDLNFIKKKYFKTKEKTILFMPTTSRLKGLSSLNFFYKNLNKFFLSGFKLLIKLHPQDDIYIKKFKKFKNIILVKDHDINLQSLVFLSDYIVCDYGGTPFGSSFLDKKIIRIKTKQAYLQKLEINSPKEILDKILPPLIVEGKVFNFDNIIKNKKIWSNQEKQKIKLVNLFFYKKNANSSFRTAEFLKKKLDND